MALLATLVDGFATIDLTKWTQNGTVVTDPSLGNMARIQLSGTANTAAGLQSATTYDATNSSVFAQVGVPQGNGLTTNKFQMRVFLDANNYVEMRFDGTSLIIESDNASVLSTTTVANYDPQAMAWWKISWASTTVTFAYAADPSGVGYTTAGTKTTSFALTAVKLLLNATFVSGSPGATGYAWVDSVNVAPVNTQSAFNLADPMTGPVMNPIRWSPVQWSSAPYVANSDTGQDGSNPWVKSTMTSATTAGSAHGWRSIARFALTGASFSARVVPGGGVTGVPYVQTQLQVQLDVNNNATIYVQSGTMFANTLNAGVATTTTIGPYSATTHAWWQIGELSGNIIYLVSPDGVTWTQVASHAHSFATTTSLTAFWFQSFPSGTIVGTSTAYVDMINTTAASWSPPAIAVAADAVHGSNTVTVTNLTTYADVQLTRNNFDGTFVGVRNANPFLGSTGTASQVFTDYEAPIGVANSYTALAYVPAPDGTTMYSASVTSATTTITAPVELVWIKNLGTPSLSGTFRLTTMDNITRPGRQQLYNVVGRARAVVVSDVQGGRTTVMTFHARTRTERAALLALMASGSTLFFQADSSKDGFEDMYFNVTGDSVETYVGRASVALDRTISMTVTEVDSPSGSTTAIPGNSWLLVASFGTWSAVSTQRTSWQDVLNRPYGS